MHDLVKEITRIARFGLPTILEIVQNPAFLYYQLTAFEVCFLLSSATYVEVIGFWTLPGDKKQNLGGKLMHSTRKVLWAVFLIIPLFLGTGASGYEVDDEVPDITARVARISFIRGDVQIRRDGGQDWERAVLNLPIVEGDEITTDAGGRFEIQLNSYSHLRIAENSYLKIIGIKDEGVAVSLPEGTLILRLSAFDKDRAFFEIDAPKTTISVQRPGIYRVDAGKRGEEQIRISVAEYGEARVYSDNSGFTLKNGRIAKINIQGDYVGEWETADAASFVDEFDSWSLERDAVIAKRLKDAHYDTYYDRDIYGAEDLSDYGEWMHTRDYGYVWKPYQNSIRQYADWSPYRYGHWRWVPPYGWTWVNDEPWGWATYHHGRWIYDDGGWYWTPYGQYRNRRSWWSPALVGVTIVNNNICWYPLPYNYGYYNYNYYYGGHGRGRGRDNHNGGGSHNAGNNGTGSGNSAQTPVPVPVPRIGPNIFANHEQKRAYLLTPPLLRVPLFGVVTTPISSFGRDRQGFRKATAVDAKAALSKTLAQKDPVRMLPTYNDLDGKVSQDIRTRNPRIMAAYTKTQTGAADRKSDGPMDQQLRKTRIFGDRLPPQTQTDVDIKTVDTGGPVKRRTGAVSRPVITRPDENNTPVKTEPTYKQRIKQRDVEPVQPAPGEAPAVKRREVWQNEPVRPPRSEPQKKREEPRYEPPTRSEPPRDDPPPRNDPPPSKSEPKSEPNKPSESKERKSKDGR